MEEGRAIGNNENTMYRFWFHGGGDFIIKSNHLLKILPINNFNFKVIFLFLPFEFLFK